MPGKPACRLAASGRRFPTSTIPTPSPKKHRRNPEPQQRWGFRLPAGDGMDPPGSVAKPGDDPPQRHKQPRAFRQSVIAGGHSLTARTLGGHAAVRLHGDDHLPGRSITLAVEPDVLVHKSRKMLNRVQKGLNLQLHRWSLVGWFVFNFNHKLNRSRGISDAFLLPTNPRCRFELKRATGQASEPIARARLRSRLPTRLSTLCLFTHKFCYRPEYSRFPSLMRLFPIFQWPCDCVVRRAMLSEVR